MALLPLLLLAAQAVPSAAGSVPDCGLVPGWTQQGPARTFDTETLFDYMDGNSEGYFAYGFVVMHGVTCTNAAGDQLVIDVSEMGDAERAWGFFVTNRDIHSPTEPIGAAGQVLPRRATFAKDPFYVEIAASPDKDHRPALRAFVDALAARIPGEGHVPEAVSWFPAAGLEPESIRLVPESVLGLRVLKHGYMAQYAVGRAFVVPDVSAAAATHTLQALRGRFEDVRPVSGIGDEAFAARDSYLKGLLVFRKGSLVAGVANVEDGADATPLAKELALRLP
jgi:hypothetical protein